MERDLVTGLQWAGLDPAEVVALRWGDVDWLRGRLQVELRLVTGPPLALANSACPRAVRASWDLLRLLEAQRASLVASEAGDGPTRFVFPDLQTSPIGALPATSVRSSAGRRWPAGGRSSA